MSKVIGENSNKIIPFLDTRHRVIFKKNMLRWTSNGRPVDGPFHAASTRRKRVYVIQGVYRQAH